MKKLFSWQTIKQSLYSGWIWWFISIVVISINIFAFSSSTGVDETNILSIFALEGLGTNGVIFITLCAIIYANIFITSEVDKGTLVIPLSTPTTRLKLLLSKALVYIVLLLSICLIVGILGSISPIIYDVEFDYTKWWTIIALWLLYSFAIGGIAFFISCCFNKSRYFLAITGVIIGGFFFLNMFAGIENLELCKYFTLQTLFDMEAVINGESVDWQMIALPIIAVPLYVTGIVIFLKKDLPI